MAPPLLALRGVTLIDGARTLFEDVDLALEPRARACLVGRNGAGKTTLLRMLAGEIGYDSGERFIQPGLVLAFVAQEPRIEGTSLADYAAAGGAARHEAEAALESFGLDPKRGCEGLSGGEIRRAALARAFASDPDILLLDEPTNHLDILAIAELEARIGRSRAAILVISHDRRFLERISRQCFWLADRRVRRLDKGFEAFEAWADAALAAEADAARRLDKALERETHWLARGVTARRARNEGRRRRLLALRAEKAERMRLASGSMSLSAGAAPTSGQRVAEVENLGKGFGARTLIKGFSTRILRGDRIAIVGPNGVGKTTLVRLLLGELTPDAGTVRLGTNLEIAYVDQARAELRDDQSLWDFLTPGGGDQIMVQGRPRHVSAYAKDFLFREDQLRQPVSSLSGGERNRLLLARALAKPSNVLVLDEPTNDLDLETLELLEDMLTDYEGVVILVSHDRDFVDRTAASTIALNGGGKVVETPGGWTDFVSQNPGFFEGPEAPAARAAVPPPAARKPAAPTKLSFKDQRRLTELEGLMESLPGQIATLETALADPGLYASDPTRFGALSAQLEKARTALVRAEEEWLELEEKREALKGS
jgi:ABC transport system ATP-binding/permease protein